MALGTVLESVMGPLRFISFYVIIVFGSNLFGSVTSPLYAAGSDPVIFGFLASLFSLVLVYWPAMSGSGCVKVCIVLQVVFISMIIAFLITSQATNASRYTASVKILYPDLWGMLGGFLYGLTASMLLLPSQLKIPNTNRFACRELIIVLVGFFGLVIMTAVLLAVFFAGAPPV